MTLLELFKLLIHKKELISSGGGEEPRNSLQKAENAGEVKGTSHTKDFLLVLFFGIIIISVLSYCVVFMFFGHAVKQYENEYRNKELAYRNAGYQKIYKRLDRDKIQGINLNIR